MNDEKDFDHLRILNEELKEQLAIVNRKFTFQNDEREKQAEELLTANKERAFQNSEKEKLEEELIIANKELVFQNDEKEKWEIELVIAHKKLADELLIAYKKLSFQNEEKEKRAAELVLTNKELCIQNEERSRLSIALTSAIKYIEQGKKNQEQYIDGLKEIMFITTHKIRQPIANIIGISNLLENNLKSPDQLKQMLEYMKQSAQLLDSFTRELTTYVYEHEMTIRFHGINE